MIFARQLHRIAAILIVALAAFAGTLAVPATAAADEPRRVAVASFGLFGVQDVFRSEATGAAEIAARRFGGDPVIVRFNSRRTADATVATVAASLETAARKMNPSSDVLFLILTSHGSPDGLAVTGGRRSTTLTPGKLGSVLDHVGVTHKAVIISACYSGVSIPRLANDNTLVITAADAHGATALSHRTRNWRAGPTSSPCWWRSSKGSAANHSVGIRPDRRDAIN
jgi:hypothetical protein